MAYDPTDVEGNERARRETAERRADILRLWESDVQWLMSGERGRRVAFRLLIESKVDRHTSTTNSIQMALENGAKNVGHFLKNAIDRTCPEQWAVMLDEQRELSKHEHAGRG